MDGATAPDIATSPSWRAMGEVKNSPEKPRLMGEKEAEGLATVAATLATGGKAASMIFQINAQETTAAERVALVATAATGGAGPETSSATLGGATEPPPRSPAQLRKDFATILMRARRRSLRASVPAA